MSADGTLAETAYYYPEPYWVATQGDWIKTLLLFFDDGSSFQITCAGGTPQLTRRLLAFSAVSESGASEQQIAELVKVLS